MDKKTNEISVLITVIKCTKITFKKRTTNL